MIYQVKLSELQQAAQLIRAMPDLSREQFYAMMEQANPQGLSQSEIEAAIQMVTGSLVTLGFVEQNDFNVIAPWIRELPDAQVPFMLDAIFKQYLKVYKDAVKEDQIQSLQNAMDEYDRLYLKFLNLQHEDPDYVEAFKIAAHFWSAQYDQCKNELIKRGVIDQPPEIIE